MASISDSADPQEILNNLRQIAVVCQRLGIDLQKTAAMGVAIGGKATGSGGAGGVGIQNPTHAPSHRGGGTGYDNLAAGGITGSTLSAQLSMQLRKVATDPLPNMNWEYTTRSGKVLYAPKADLASLPALAAYREMEAAKGGDVSNLSNVIRQEYEKNRFSKKGSIYHSSRRRAMPTNLFGGRAERKMIRAFTTLHGITTMYGALTDPVDEEKGETRSGKLQSWGVDVARMGVASAEVFAGMKTATAMRRGWQVGGPRIAGRAMGAASGARLALGRVAAPLLLAEGALLVFSTAIDLAEVERSAQYTLRDARDGWSPELRPSKTGAKPRRPPLSPEATRKFMESVEEDRYKYYIDPVTGERSRRSFLGEWWQRQAFIRMIGAGDKQRKEIEYRMKESKRLHESAEKKGQIMDWVGAINDITEAKKLIIAEEAMPFFWKNPQKYLRNMESARIASRNWARSQQPRGGDRTGD